MISVPRRARTSLALATTLALVPALGYAQAWTKQGDETLLLRLGAVSTQFDTSARIDGNSSGGTPVNLESDMGLADSKSTFSLSGAWRFAKNHRIDGAYEDNKRSASKVTERSYTIGDTTVPAGTNLSVEQKTALGYLGYRYSFYKSPDAEWAAGLGMYGGNFKLKFNANSPVVNIDKSTTLPLPVLVLTGDFYLTDRMTLTGSIRGLKLSIGDVDGSVVNASLAGEYLFTNNFGIGASIDHFDMQADVTKSSYKGNAELKSTSGRLYLTVRF